MKRTATCSCGDLKLTVQKAPFRVSICHCFACQKRTGSVFGVQARFYRKEALTEGDSLQFVRIVEEDEKITYHFCPKCGSTVYWFLASMPEVIATGIGNFTDPNFPLPTISVFEFRKHAWVDMPKLQVEHFDKINQ